MRQKRLTLPRSVGSYYDKTVIETSRFCVKYGVPCYVSHYVMRNRDRENCWTITYPTTGVDRKRHLGKEFARLWIKVYFNQMTLKTCHQKSSVMCINLAKKGVWEAWLGLPSRKKTNSLLEMECFG